MDEAQIAAAAAAEAAAAVAAAEAAAAAAAAEAAAKQKTDDSGKSKPSDAEAKLLKEVMDKKAALKAATDQVEQVKAQLKAFEGLDPVAVRALVAEAESRKTKALEDQGAWDTLKKQLVDTHTSELTATKSQIEALAARESLLASKVADLTVGVAFGQSKFLAEDVSYSVAKMRSFFGPHFEFDGEKVVGYDKPAGAKDRVVLMDAKGDPLPFEAALAKLVDADPDRESMLKSKVKPGAASHTDTKSKARPGVVVELTGRDRITAALAGKKS